MVMQTVLIPLDYYRILGVPIKNTEKQLKQAYKDRSLQLPRREYSKMALESRKLLLDKAYSILANPDSRAKYEQDFLQLNYSEEDKIEAGSTEQKPYIPSIPVAPEELIGAIIFLQELGEYELVIRLGSKQLTELGYVAQTAQEQEEQQLISRRQDLILTVALAYKELSREEWQQQNYQNAVVAAEKARDLLQQAANFPALQKEITKDLNKLRPYYILELLAHPLEAASIRAKGIELLQQMLENRGGIAGKGNDGSALEINSFLDFLRDARKYLTLDEQEKLFTSEAQRPSPVANYILVYALIAKGFARKQPSAILAAQERLLGMSKYQDVYIERAICSLLLGQPQIASRTLEMSQEKEIIASIKENSAGQPDLLPGLCVYTENWLNTEVFSQFRDLQNFSSSLAEYFADHSVQDYLTQLTSKYQNSGRTSQGEFSQKPAFEHNNLTSRPSNKAMREKRANTPKAGKNYSTAVLERPASHNRVNRNKPNSSNLSSEEQFTGGIKAKTENNDSLGWLARGISLCIILALGYVIWNNLSKQPTSDSRVEQEVASQTSETPIAIDLSVPVVNLPKSNNSAQKLSQAEATAIIQSWLNSKSQAEGAEHKIEQLNKILAQPLLARKRQAAINLKNSQSYREFQHDIKVELVQQAANNPNLAVVRARVKEIAKHYYKGKLVPGQSYNDLLLVEYQLIRQNDKWLINEIKLVKSL
ncbi:MAG: DUF4101 domain-containing protein [Cyanobacteria bacterium J083]|nr:MAG: DUF4101 domain-containing protein [Cyanobacteria bacterium J083]